MKAKFGRIEEVNKELWLLLSLFGICLLLNLARRRPADGAQLLHAADARVGLPLRTPPRDADRVRKRPARLPDDVVQPGAAGRHGGHEGRRPSRWLDIIVWGGVLIVTGYSMGTLYEHSAQPDQRAAPDLSWRADDPPPLHRQGCLHREPLVSRLGLRRDDRERSSTCRWGASRTCAPAALLHDIGKLDISRELLYKAARLTEEEFKHMQEHVNKGVSILEPVGGSLRRVIPIVSSHHDKFDGSGYTPDARQDIPLEARIISVADVYDSLTSDRPYRKAMSTVRRQRDHRQGIGHRLRPHRRGRVRRSVPQGRARSSDGRGVGQEHR